MACYNWFYLKRAKDAKNMLTYQEQAKEFTNNYSAVIDEAVINLSKTFDTLFYEKNSSLILPTIETAISMLSKSYNIPTKMQICYNIANGHHDFRTIEKTDSELHLEKEIYYLRTTLDMYENNFPDDDDSIDNIESKVAKYIAMRSYTNLGNAFRALNRYIAAIDCFHNALLISNGFAMASLNLSFLLFHYAQLQIRPYEQRYYHHACFYYYEQTKNHKVNLESQDYLDALENCISAFTASYIDGYLSKPLDLPPFHVPDQAEFDYRNYLLMFRLFLDPCLDILSEPCFAVDSIHLPFNYPLSEQEKEFVGLFNQIKQEYNLARYLWYKVSTDDTYEHYADKELDLIDTGDLANYSLQESLMRIAFKTAYSLFDRIGFFINEYFQVGLTEAKISFKNVWKEKLCDGNGQVYFIVPNPIIRTHLSNPLIQAMFWLQKDFFEDKKISVTAPHAERIFQMRNDMEHNCLRTGKQSYDVTFTKYTSDEKIEDNTYRLLRLARELIIYLCLAVGFDRKKNRDTF